MTMRNIVDLRHFQHSVEDVDGYEIKRFVYSGLDFELPESIYEAVEDVIAELWNSTPPGQLLTEEDFTRALAFLKSRGILLNGPFLEQLSARVVLALENFGYLRPLNN